MRASFACGLALLLAGCGSSGLEAATTAGQTGGAGGVSSAGGAGGAGNGGAGNGGAGAAPGGTLCDEVKVTSWSCTPQNYHDPLVSFVADSGLIFRGTVTALHATTPGLGITDTSRTVVATLDATLYDGGMLTIPGEEVTVQLLAAPTMAVGYQGYFFTSPWIIGQSVGVLEVAHVDPGVFPTVDADVPGIEQLLADERLYGRMKTAGAVLVGTVTDVTGVPSGPPVSEHDPLWAVATITADCTLRGAPLASARAVFATSDDVAWYTSPKLTVGQEGVFLLQPKPTPTIWSIPDDVAYVITDRLDVHPPADRAHLATLVLCPPYH